MRRRRGGHDKNIQKYSHHINRTRDNPDGASREKWRHIGSVISNRSLLKKYERIPKISLQIKSRLKTTPNSGKVTLKSIITIDPLHKWRLNLNNNTWYILSLTLVFQDKGIFT